ncbi:chaperonin 10-like protein [Rhypophila decipiens]|uniref:Chaperonin 10-like protein n=1 Tax=Rhypophila decipiens TaxID=261697 RepID=A0AAN7B6P9_9PEZI|nr:chaperonin 10-like protein [Rhypophila decipiens]
MSTHLAAVLPSPGQPLTIHERATPKPGPNELLIAVKSIALNPADVIIGEDTTGQFIPLARDGEIILGFDLSGLVLDVGENVPSKARFQQGKTRIAAYSASFWRSWDPNYGALQQRCLVPWQHCVILPDNISFHDGASIPVAVSVALNAWEILGLELGQDSITGGDNVCQEIRGEDEDKRVGTGREALLIWGASSSVGTMGVQTAALLRSQGQVYMVYATAGEANMGYAKSLGADRVWDYKDANLLEKISASAKKDGVVIRRIFLAKGNLPMCREVLGIFYPEIHGGDSCEGENIGDYKSCVTTSARAVRGKIASAPPIPAEDAGDDLGSERSPKFEMVWLVPSMDEERRLAQFRYWMGEWLTHCLAKGTVRPSPEVKVLGKGLEAINGGIQMLKNGVSCCKLVVEIDD